MRMPGNVLFTRGGGPPGRRSPRRARTFPLVAALVLAAAPAFAAPAAGQAGRDGGPVRTGDRALEEGSGPLAVPRVSLPGGRFLPQYAPDGQPVEVAPFTFDAVPVTVSNFLAFVEANPAWRRSRVPEVFAGAAYLASWREDLDPGLEGEARARPVTEVTWFAARAYCAWRGARLPTTLEWEWAARAEDRASRSRLLALYGARPEPDALPPVGRTHRNVHGIWDLHGLVWEWTQDFNARMATGSARNDRRLDRGLFCAAGAVDATDLTDYAAFLRWAFRASLEGRDAGPLLGFRCAEGGGGR